MPRESLEQKLHRVGSAVTMLRDSPSGPFKSPYPLVYTNWQDEQRAWHRSATLFDQSHHMTDVYFRGPDVNRLLSDTGTNSFATYGRDRAKHFVACNHDGMMIGTAVLFGLDDDEACLVGPTAVANWLQFLVETGDYDVEVARDERTQDQTGMRLNFRFEIEGPAAGDILAKVNGKAIDAVKFFAMTEFDVGGHRVRALSHTMAGVPGSTSMGMEFWGPLEHKQDVLEALLDAGAAFDMRQGGMLAYYTGSIESGYPAQPTPAIYTGERMRAYREWLPGDGYEGKLSVGGSLRHDEIDDYYVSPYDFGYGHLVRFDHDFVGRAALEAMRDRPHRTKVWLRWDEADVGRVYTSSLFDGPKRAKSLETPLARYARVHADAVLVDDRLVGVSTICGYTVNAGAWLSVAFVDEEVAQDGRTVELLWGEENGGTAKLSVERHEQTTIRTTVVSEPPVR
jgi:vanillate/3-O-methylgallate O-demethylase